MIAFPLEGDGRRDCQTEMGASPRIHLFERLKSPRHRVVKLAERIAKAPPFRDAENLNLWVQLK